MTTSNHELEMVPTVGMAGLYSLKAPYTSLIRPQIEYTCVAVTSLQGMIASGEDPYAAIYQPNGDTQQSYEDDLAAGSSVITLQSQMGDIIRVPNSALNGLPTTDGVRYRSAVLGISLSALPEDIDLTQLKGDIADLVLDTLGVASTVYASTVGGVMILSHETHEAIEAARVAKQDINPGNLAIRRKLELENQAMRDRLAMLEAYIAQNLPPTPAPPAPPAPAPAPEPEPGP